MTNKALLLSMATMIFTCIACNQLDDCSDFACFTPAPPLYFDLVNAEGDNVFGIGRYQIEQLEVLDASTNAAIPYKLVTSDSTVEINSVGWEDGEEVLSFMLDEAEIFTFSIHTEWVSEDCCNFPRQDEISLTGAAFESTDSYSYVVTIGE